jgi:ABC-type dipeptide/oligopeptide/nickel transport system permease component
VVRRWPGSGPAVAKAIIRKESTMIAATALAVVGLVVIAFLNRIP